MFLKHKFMSTSVLAAFVSATSVFVSSQALAQDAGEIEEVVVSGFRQSLEAALDQKRDSVGAVDSILAEDIADFPDLNLAESLQRIPGVTITRSAGEGRQISVRGLGPQFTRVRINGMETLATGGGTDAAGGTNRSRSFDFNTFASELFNSLKVNKTAAAEVEEGSLGATVDLATGKPFDYDGFTMAASAQMGYNDLSGESDPRVAFLVSNTFADETIGALFSIAWSERTLQDDGTSTVRWQPGGTTATTTFQSAPAGGPTLAELNAAFRPRIPRYDSYRHDQERLGVTAGFQFAPSDSTQIGLDILYSNFDATRQEVFLESPVFSSNGANAIAAVDVVEAEIDSNNTLVYGVFDDVDIRSENRFDELETTFTQYTLSIEHDFSDSFRIKGMVGSAESEHDNPIQTTLLFDETDIDGYIFDYRGNSREPRITYGNTALTDPDTWTLTQIRLRPQTADNTLDSIIIDLAYDINDSLTLKGGINSKNYEFVSTEMRRSNGTTSNQESVIPAEVAAIDLSLYSKVFTFEGEVGPSVNPSQWLIPDVATAISQFDTSIFSMGIETALGNNYTVEEEDLSVYLQLDFEVDLAGMALRGNVGARNVETELTSTGYVFTSGTPLLVTAKNDYSDTLPSVNFALDVTEDMIVRFGWAKVMTRPNLGQLPPGATVSVSGNNKTVTAGNPQLDPFRADTIDLAWEWYFAEESLLSIAYFTKDIDTFVQTVRTTGPFTGNSLGIPDSVAVAACGSVVGCAPADTDWQFSQPRNTPGGDLDGYEISYQQPLSMLPGIWSNFGLILNYTSVESKIDYVDATGAVVVTENLTGLSESSYNATIYYEGDVFSGRVSFAYRDDYLTTIPGRNGNDVEGTKASTNVDVAASWALNDSLKLTFEGINLTDEFEDQYVDSSDRLSYYHHTGAQYYLGVRYSY